MMEKFFFKKYYYKSGIGAESFDQTITINRQGKIYLTAPLQQNATKGIQLQKRLCLEFFM